MANVQINAGAGSKSPKRAATRKPVRTVKTSENPLALLDEDAYAEAFEALDASEKHAVFREMGEELARTLGARVIAQMLNDTPLSGREIGARLGFDHSALSRIARGDSKTGPTLWKVYALAEALGYRIELNAVKK
ncbi:helix-turn-helix domain-containing protein [Roseobacter sp. YSTF-M11]|uniref:Helix-turn-helix domain-containing protein n=1 Tax=Roseobacter insulae TaxID=2859783 RepID=A0A9X1FTP1_9RHOB|nr:helix-turn-helix domain-containing protein [Roseobacter insulae]MBW4707541.1 helix-turn-helix domain-containing protein [Roseobacter insulae]